MNNLVGEVAITDMDNCIEYRDMLVKVVDNVKAYSKGEKMTMLDDERRKVLAYKCSGVEKVGILVSKLMDLNKLRMTFGIDEIPEDELVSMLLENCVGKLSRYAEDVKEKIREKEMQIEAGLDDEVAVAEVAKRYPSTIAPTTVQEVHELLQLKEKVINKSGDGGYDKTNALLMSFVNNYNPEIIYYSCGKKGHKSRSPICENYKGRSKLGKQMVNFAKAVEALGGGGVVKEDEK